MSTPSIDRETRPARVARRRHPRWRLPAHVAAARPDDPLRPAGRRDPAGPRARRDLDAPVRHGPRHVDLPRQVDADALRLPQRVQPARPHDRGTRRVDLAGGARRDRARDGGDDRLPERGDRDPRRHVPRRGTQVHGRGRRFARRELPRGRAGAASRRGEPAVRPRPPHAEHGRPAAPHRSLRRHRSAAWQEARDDVGVFAELRQAAVGAAGRHHAHGAHGHGRRARAS